MNYPSRGGADASLHQTRPKYRRAPTTGLAHEKRVAFGKQWGEINSQLAQRLREGRR